MTCKSCGSTTHHRSSNKACPHYRPRSRPQNESTTRASKRAKGQEEDLTQPTTVKTKLNRFVKTEQARMAIRRMVKSMKPTTFEGYHIANATLLYCLNGDTPFPVTGVEENKWEEFFYACLKAASDAAGVSLSILTISMTS